MGSWKSHPVAILSPPGKWAAWARCVGRDPRTWDSQRPAAVLQAQEVCGRCPVQRQCLDHAISNPELGGTWGGLSEWGRKTLRAYLEKRS